MSPGMIIKSATTLCGVENRLVIIQLEQQEDIYINIYIEKESR